MIVFTIIGIIIVLILIVSFFLGMAGIPIYQDAHPKGKTQINPMRERTAEDVHKKMMLLETEISNDKRMIRENSNNEQAMLSFSEHTFTLLVKRIKHGFYLKGDFEKGNKLEELIEINREPINHTISANAITVMMNTNLYSVSLEDTFMELLKEYSEYLKPILNQVVN